MAYTLTTDDTLTLSSVEDLDLIEASSRILLSNLQHSTLLKLVVAEDIDSKQQIIDHNVRLIVKIAKSYSKHGVALLELIKVGNQGLIHAMERFEVEGGFKFATYAARCVRQHIEMAIHKKREFERTFYSFHMVT
jgi:RNA polymerase nonessential primary-like sigma factor